MQQVNLNVRVRNKTGKGFAHLLRRKGFIPGIFYGPSEKNIALSVDKQELNSLLRSSGLKFSIISLIAPRDKEINGKTALLKDWQLDPISKELRHVDLYCCDQDKEISLSIPVHYTGKPKGLANGGIMEIQKRELVVFCLPKDLPNELTIDVSDLDLGHSLKVKDMKLTEGLRIDEPGDTALVSITALAKAEKESTTEAEESVEENKSEA